MNEVGMLIYTPCPPTKRYVQHIRTNLASWVMFKLSFPSRTTKQYVQQRKSRDISSHFSILPPTTRLQSNKFNIWKNMRCRVILETYPPPTLQAKGSTYEERWHVLFPTQVYLYGVLTPFKGLHAWAAWFYACLPGVSLCCCMMVRLSSTCLPHLIQWEKIALSLRDGRFFLFYLVSCQKN